MVAKFKITAGALKCLKVGGGRKIDQAGLVEFWERVGSAHRNGVYIFGIRASKRWKPLYVGQAKRQDFRARINQHVNGNGRFNRILKDIKKGTPWLFLVGRVGKGRSSNAAINILENYVINDAFARNKNIDNDRGLDKPIYEVRGFGRGKPTIEVRYLKTMLGY
jgi:hypothetical protein